MLTLSTSHIFLFLVLLAGLSVLYRHHSSSRRSRYTFAPGPRGWPVIGNLLDLSIQERPWIVFRDWARTYGDIVFVKALDRPMLIISSADIAIDLMEKRSSIYSDRPVSTMAELTGWEFNLGLVPYGNRWRSIRKYVHQYFNGGIVPSYHGKQTAQIHNFLRRCLANAGKQLDPSHVRLTLASTIIDIVYGMQIESMDDEYIKIVVKSLKLGSEGQTTGKYWVDFMPFLKYVPAWVPGTASVRLGARCRPLVQEVINKPYDTVKSGAIAHPSMALDLIGQLKEMTDSERRKEEEIYARHATAVTYVGGSDTTYSTIQTFFCNLATNPNIQKKAQVELDLVVGPDRLPTFDDYDSLPFIQAIFLECLRWLPVVPLGIPHRSTEDDCYNGYFIPAGTCVITNVWHILRNPTDYPEPEKFNPERFMKDGAINPNVRNPSDIAFGFGRRVCPGEDFARDTAFLLFASVLHVFDIMPSLDENGNELDPTPQMSTGTLSYPEPLNYMLKPRSETAEKLIRDSVL